MFCAKNRNRIAITSLGIFVILLTIVTPVRALEKVFFKSITEIYQVTFPVEHGEENYKTVQNIDGQISVYSTIDAEYRADNPDDYIKYSIQVEPLQAYKPFKQAVDELVDQTINFYHENYKYQIEDFLDHGREGRWGKTLIIKFYTPIKDSEDKKAWYIKRQIFYQDSHLFIIEALGAEKYVLSNTSYDFFHSFKVNPGRIKARR